MTNSLPSGSLISYFSSKVKSDGGINLAQGLPGFNPPDELLECLRKASTKNVHQYPPGTGNFRLSDFIIDDLKTEISISRNELLMTCGATEALSLIFLYLTQKIKQSFSVLAFDPAYESYSRLPEHFGIQYIPFGNTENTNINFESLAKTIQKEHVKIMFISSPGNPFGNIKSYDDLKRLCQMSVKMNFYIIFDAVYKELYINNKAPQPFDFFGPNLFYVNSFSKLLSITGWRIGYLLAHPSHMTGIRSMHDYTGLCVPSVLQEALVDYLKNYNGGKDYIIGLRKKIQNAFNFMIPSLTKLGFHIPEIDGGYFLWTKLPEQFKCGFEFAEMLYEEEKIAVVPGIHFSKHATNYIRLNVARPDEELIKAHFGIERFVKKHQ